MSTRESTQQNNYPEQVQLRGPWTVPDLMDDFNTEGAVPIDFVGHVVHQEIREASFNK